MIIEKVDVEILPRCATVNDQHLLLLRDSLASLNALTTLDIDFGG